MANSALARFADIDGDTTLDQLAIFFDTTIGHMVVALAGSGPTFPTRSMSGRILAVLRYRTEPAKAAEIIRMVDPSRRQQVYQRLAKLANDGLIVRVSDGHYASLSCGELSDRLPIGPQRKGPVGVRAGGRRPRASVDNLGGGRIGARPPALGE